MQEQVLAGARRPFAWCSFSTPCGSSWFSLCSSDFGHEVHLLNRVVHGGEFGHGGFGEGLALAASIRWNRNKLKQISDPLHGYRGCSPTFANSLELQPCGVTADLEMVHHAYGIKAKVAEFPIQESVRAEGTTHFPAYKTEKQLIKYLIRP